MVNRAQDWFAQAEKDLEQAEASLQGERHEWACFAAHQAAEKALKALHLHYGQQAWGHMVVRLVNDLPEEIALPDLLKEQAKVLDNFYIPTRYPDSYPEGAPFQYFGQLQSQEAIRYAGEILEFVSDALAESR